MKTKRLLTEFEENMVWMSYRYAIGRHTAVATTHAYNLMKYVYGRLDQQRKNFMAVDIYRQMDHIFYPYFSCNELACHTYKPVNYVIDYICKFGFDTKVNVEIKETSPGVISHVTHPLGDTYSPVASSYLHDLSDLISWQELAEILSDDIKIVTVDNEGKTETYECIETYSYVYGEEYNVPEDAKKFFKKIYRPIKNGITEKSYLISDHIIKVEDKPKPKEQIEK